MGDAQIRRAMLERIAADRQAIRVIRRELWSAHKIIRILGGPAKTRGAPTEEGRR